ncbi:MAG: hypothetical protein ACRYFA_06425 [Janthinobacterium lividum]
MIFFLPALLLFFFILPVKILFAQIALGTISYVQSFDGVALGLPEGFTVETGAIVTLKTAATAWKNAWRRFRFVQRLYHYH